jgi:hypothetical protein
VRVTRPDEIDEVRDELMLHDWVVYTKHCLNHTASVVDYLAAILTASPSPTPVSKASMKAA